MKLLVSARDPGAALSLAPVIRACEDRPGLALEIVTQSPATEIFADRGIRSRVFGALPLADAEDPRKGDLLTEAAREISRFEPDALLTGLSGPGLGVDEALLFRAGGRPTYSVQDLEGLVTSGFGAPASTYFVADFEAERLTRRRSGIRTVVTGSLKHAHYAEIDPLRIRARERERLALGGRKSATFYGQPSWKLGGYESSIREFVRALGATLPDVTLYYRPHPKENERERAATLAVIAAGGFVPRLDPISDVDASLCATDLAVSCHSTCGIDHIQLQKRSDAPLGLSLYLVFENDIRRSILEDCGLEYPSCVANGYALGVTDRNSLRETLARAFDENAKVAIWERIRRDFPDPKSSAETVIRTIVLDHDSRSK